MPDQSTQDTRDLYQAFLADERTVQVQNFRLACMLGFIFTLAASGLDVLVYPGHIFEFLQLRVICSVLILFIWWLVRTEAGSRHYRLLGLILPALPTFFLSLMIYRTEGASSPYYGALNLVLLGAGIVLRWSLRDSLIVFLEVMAMYLVACIAHGLPTNSNILFNNGYFLFVTGVFVVIASHFYNGLRFREFSLRYELDKNRKALEESNQKLMELDQVKSRFFANISHELRTPLTLLLAPLEVMMRRFGRAVDEETRNTLQTMHSNGMRLLKLINDLLDLVRLESGVIQVRPEPVEVTDFVKGLASAACQMADDKKIKLATFVDPALGVVQTDRDKLEKIVLNLVFNALKFTPAGGSVDLRAEKQGEEFVITVADTGMGISAKNLPNIFSRFWQADDSSRRKFQGVGIGLALVKELTEVQGGTASVDSVEGKGTTFTVRLPYIKAAPEEKPAARPTPDDTTQPATPGAAPAATVSSQEWLTNLYRRAELFPAMTPLQDTLKQVEVARNGNTPRVLIADDEPDMLRFLKTQLAPHYQVIEAVDGQQAVEKASQFLPDLILLDMMMPEKDGMQACREIRQHSSTQSIPVVLITARADEETKLAALEAGASDFLPKPFSTTELHVRVKNLVDAHEYQLKIARQNQVLETTIEQLKETETQLVQTEKLASLGRMSAGIIHEINNPLNFATTGLYTLRNKGKHIASEQKAEYDDILNDVEEGIKRVKTIVSDLRMFTHPDTESRQPVELADVVTASLRFLSGEWKDVVQVEHHLAEHQTILANKNKLIHVLVNLLQNAMDAVKSKKFLNGETPCIRIEGRLEKGLSLLMVRDNGPGIENKDLDKIFDPFFTTKDVGKGMGLGLSICHRIVQEFDGRISVKTEPGKFCEFTLEFPATG